MVFFSKVGIIKKSRRFGGFINLPETPINPVISEIETTSALIQWEIVEDVLLPTNPSVTNIEETEALIQWQ